MTTLTVKPKNKKELSKAKKMLKVLEISFEDNDDKPYNPEFVKKILEARKENGSIQIDPANPWKSLGLL